MPILKRLFSTCEIIPDKRVIKKYDLNPVALGFFENEVKWYQQFMRKPGILRHIPKLIDFSRDTMILEYAGEPITINTVPVNFKNQLRQIASFLEGHHCRHSDITPSNLLVYRSNLFLIDFAFAVGTEENPFRKWKHVEKSMLGHLGGVYRAPHWPDDKYSLNVVYQEFTPHSTDKLFFYH